MRGRIPAGVREIKDGKSELANMHERLGFESCVEVCPTGAITVKKM
jgi:NAD-dependent dihydropyrimidine dehydrogenase PreA subunit